MGASTFSPPLSVEAVDVVVVGGGGGGGTSQGFSNAGAGGGGGGGVLSADGFDISTFAVPIDIVVGAGGAPGAAGDNNSGSNGSDSVFGDGETSELTALGGGFGIGGNPDNDIQPAGVGGSGGGGRGAGSAGTAASQTLPTGVLSYGNDGGETVDAGTGAAAGGGGGAGTAGSDGAAGGGDQSGGNGGDGISLNITGTATFYAGGGGAGGAQTGTPGTGGQGGGGSGANDSTDAEAGDPNTGGGGGGGSNSKQGAAGGSGTVIIRYKAPSLAISLQPSATTLSGEEFQQQPELTLLDGDGTAISGVDITVFQVSGSAALGGTLTATTNASGVAAFTDLSFTGSAGDNILGFKLDTAPNFVISDAVEITGEAPYYSRATGNWDQAASWSRNSHTGVASANTPGAEDEIIIGGGHTITLNFSSFTLTSPGTLTVSDTGVLALSGDNHITGTGTFLLETGGSLEIGSADGVNSSGSDGNIRTDTRTFESDANFIYNGSSAQVTGTALPQLVNDLRIDNSSGVRAEISHQVNGTLYLDDGAFIVGDGLSLIANTKDIGTGELQFELEVGGQSGYRLISSPLAVTFSNLLSEVITQGFTGASLTDVDPLQPNVLWYDETYEGTDNQRWRAPGNITDSAVTGRGYHVYMFGAVTGDSRYNDPFPYTLVVNGQENEGTAGEVDFGVTYTVNGDTGWNLVGNPFGASIDWDDGPNWTKVNIDPTLYVWDPNTNNYLTWNGTAGDITDGIIAPFQGFWVKANAAAPELVVSRDAKTLTAGAGYVGKNVSEDQGEPSPSISIVAHRSEYLQSSVHFSFTETGKVDLDRFDAYRLLPPPDVQNYVEFYSRVENERLSVNNLPRRFGRVIDVPLELNGFVDGNAMSDDIWLTVSGYEHIPEEWVMELVNEHTGEKFAITKGDSVLVNMGHMTGKKVTRTNEAGKVTTRQGDAHMNFTLRIAPGEDALGISREFMLHPNYPNPFNPTTTLAFELPVPDRVRLEIFDLLGRRVAILVDENLPAGSHSRVWNASNLSSGIYMIRLVTSDGIYTRKMTLIK